MKKIFILLSLVLISFAGFYYYLNNKIRRDFGRNINYFTKLVEGSSSNLPPNFNFIILGLDRRNDSLEKTETTDTIIFGHFDQSETFVKLFPLPRDLWSYDLKSKINQTYPQSKTTPNRFDYISASFQKLLDQPIDRTIIITTDNLIELANIIDGVDVNLTHGFVDEKYPNPEYIKNPNPKTPIYKTISFPAGLIHLDSKNITEFVRSRKSAETTIAGGTDLGRIQRQALLIDALIDKLKQPSVLLNYSRVVKLYNFWQFHLETNFTDSDLVSILKNNRKHISRLKIEKYDITHLLYHPNNFINPQWVFLPINNDYSKLSDFILSKIN
ncbi:LCP family protein [Candidatus Shapirobacteria bacterium]|nr:LCP family protein [Candidatus Shapirobacteria bacterium]